MNQIKLFDQYSNFYIQAGGRMLYWKTSFWR